MGRGNTTTVYRNGKGQYQTTIPRVIAEAMGLEKGTKLEWVVDGRDILKVRIKR